MKEDEVLKKLTLFISAFWLGNCAGYRDGYDEAVDDMLFKGSVVEEATPILPQTDDTSTSGDTI